MRWRDKLTLFNILKYKFIDRMELNIKTKF